MDRHETVMKAHSDLIGWIGFVFDPRLSIAEELAECRGYFVERNPQIPLAASEIAGPPPDLAQHLPVQAGDEFLRQQIAPASSQGPVLPAQDIFLLSLIQLAAACNVRWNEIALFFDSQRRCGV